MKLKRIKINGKKICSLGVLPFTLMPSLSFSDIISFDYPNAILTTGEEVFLYFTTGKSDNDYAFIRLHNQLGYIKNSFINYRSYDTNDYYEEVVGEQVILEDTFLYLDAYDNSQLVCQVFKDSVVSLIAKNKDNWYIVSYNNQIGFIKGNYLKEKDIKVRMAKATKNNVNIRLNASLNSQIIGFADITDQFKILNEDNGWYQIDYLGSIAYISKDVSKEVLVDQNYLNVLKMVYLTEDSWLYNNPDGDLLSFLPKYQNAFVLEEKKNFYQVMIDGVVGYIEKRVTKNLSSTCVIIDLGRQILKVYQNNQEMARFHIISGRKTMQTDIGCFQIGHKMRDYQLTPTNFVKYWIQYNGNQGIHDASWQSEKNFINVAKDAYYNYSNNSSKTYPFKHGSHGCNNMREEDVSIVFSLVHKKDNVLVIGPNSLLSDKLISNKSYQMIKKLV